MRAGFFAAESEPVPALGRMRHGVSPAGQDGLATVGAAHLFISQHREFLAGDVVLADRCVEASQVRDAACPGVV